jgi:formylglycine-generating enzyme required for sulfatase activity/predicted Ser/Thr protein kinase
MTDSVPDKLGKYKIIEEVGRGGFAAVYKAVDTTLDRTVALKVLAPHLLWDPTFVQRFQREAKVAANLDHPNIVTIYEVSQIEGVYFIAMQFLEGRTLSQLLQAEGAWPVSRVQGVIEQVASALDYAHARGFVHRDIKPSNVIVTEDGQATLTDFGLVKAGEGTKLSTTGVVFGTPEYMSPEQAEGKVLDARSDIYSLGVVLFEMLAGRAPFVADTTPAVLYKHVHEPPPLDELPFDLPRGVVAVVEKALAKKREARYQSAGEMAWAFKAAVETTAEPKVERKEEPAVRGGLPIWGWAGIALVAALVIGGAIFLVIFQEDEAPAVPPGMVYVPAGEFIMGSDVGGEDEKPVHTVYLDAFCIDKTEVTNAQYRKCVKSGVCNAPSNIIYDYADYAQHPVVDVGWNDADAYCRWAGKRLPTEAEWEKAARGPDGLVYPWGNKFNGTKLNFADKNTSFDWSDLNWDDGYAGTAPVGSYPDGASPYGALDMAGNVWEWVADWYDSGYYAISPENNPKGPASGDTRVYRGGSWRAEKPLVRAAERERNPPTSAFANVGFRCAR